MTALRRTFYITTTLFFFIFSSPSIFSQSLDEAFVFNTSGILTQKLRLALIAQNMAHLSTLEDENTGLPWQKRYAVLVPDQLGVRVLSIEKSTAPFGRYYDPEVPQSNEEGYTSYPNVNYPDEMVNLAYTETIFEANVTAFKTTKAVYQSVVDMLR